MKKQNGMTLIELVIVIIVLGIIAAVAAPRFADVKTDAVASARDGSVGAVLSAYTVAVADKLDTPTYDEYIAKIRDMTCDAAGLCVSDDFDADGSADIQFQFYDVAGCAAGDKIAAGTDVPSHYVQGAVNTAPVDGTCTAALF